MTSHERRCPFCSSPIRPGETTALVFGLLVHGRCGEARPSPGGGTRDVGDPDMAPPAEDGSTA
jgi:hypothetical protein